jgi:hypothetical protein
MDRYIEGLAKNGEDSKLVEEFRTKPDNAFDNVSQQTKEIL